MYESPDAIGPKLVVDDFRSNFASKKLNFEPEVNTYGLDDKAFESEEYEEYEPKKKAKSHFHYHHPATDVVVERDLSHASKKPSSYQTISFGPFPSKEEKGQANWKVPNYHNGNLKEVRTNDEDNILSQKPFEEKPEKENPSNFQVVSFGEHPHQPLLLNPEENSVQAPEAVNNDDVIEVFTEKNIPVVSQVVSFEESPQQSGIEDEMMKDNKKVIEAAVNPEATAFVDTPQENMFDKVNEMVDKANPPSSYQMVSFGENPELSLAHGDTFKNKKVKKSLQQQQLPNPSFDGEEDMFEKINKMVEKEKPTSYQVVSFGENPQLSIVHDGQNKKDGKSSQQQVKPLSDPSFDGEEDMFDQINKMVEKEQPTSYQLVSFGENPQLSVEQGDLLQNEKKVKKSVPKQQQQQQQHQQQQHQQQQHLSTSSFDSEEDVFEKINKMVEKENPSSYQFVTLGENIEVENDRMKKSTIFENSKFDANPMIADNDDMFGKMHGMVELNTPPSSYQFVNFGDNSQQVSISSKFMTTFTKKRDHFCICV